MRFSYPGSGQEVLSGVDLLIPAGQSLAIVGANGAGKTTLIKLLLRLYDPTAGVISVDGTALEEFEPRSWQQRGAAVFQDFLRYPWSAADNVALRHRAEGEGKGKGKGKGSILEHSALDPTALDPTALDPAALERAALERAARRAGALSIVESLPEGWETVLSRAFGGVDLSGGEWQRVALARALYAGDRGAGHPRPRRADGAPRRAARSPVLRTVPRCHLRADDDHCLAPVLHGAARRPDRGTRARSRHRKRRPRPARRPQGALRRHVFLTGRTVTPMSEPPMSEPPMSEPPMSEPPMSEPPMSEPPMAETPMSETPMADPATTGPPVRERLAAARLLVTYPFRVDAWRTSANLALVVVSQLAGVVVALALKLATDAAVQRDSDAAIVAVLVLVAGVLTSTAGEWASFVLRAGIADRTVIALDVELATLSSGTVGVEHLERPEYLDRVEHLRQFRDNLVLVPNQFALTAATVVRIGVSLYLLAEVQPLLALLPIFGIPALLATQREAPPALTALGRRSGIAEPLTKPHPPARGDGGRRAGAAGVRVAGRDRAPVPRCVRPGGRVLGGREHQLRSGRVSRLAATRSRVRGRTAHPRASGRTGPVECRRSRAGGDARHPAE